MLPRPVAFFPLLFLVVFVSCALLSLSGLCPLSGSMGGGEISYRNHAGWKGGRGLKFGKPSIFPIEPGYNSWSCIIFLLT